MPEVFLATGLVHVYTRARQVLSAARFCQTSDEHLLINPVKALRADEEQALLELAMAPGDF